MDSYKAYIKDWIKCLVTLTPSEEDEFVDIAAQHALNEFQDKDSSSLTIPFKMIIITAEV